MTISEMVGLLLCALSVGIISASAMILWIMRSGSASDDTT
jgi:hypothetical protein